MYQLSFFNYTKDRFLVSPGDVQRLSLHPSSQVRCALPDDVKHTRSSKITFEVVISDPEKPNVSFSLKLGRWSYHTKIGWRLLDVTGADYTVYRFASQKKDHAFFIFPQRSLQSFLGDIPSSLPLSSLMLPGTHESVAFYGWPISQCQETRTPLAVQFASGIRVIDVRLSIINGTLVSYHGIYPQRLPFLTILEQVHTFLTSPEGKSETIIMSIKQEDKASFLFSQLVHDGVFKGPGGREMWFLENRIPTLGEVRGKVVMFSRFGGNGQGWDNGLEGMGIHPTTWPDSKQEGFEWSLKGTNVRTHDWYNIPSFLSIPEKAEKSFRIFTQPASSPAPTLSISFLSASSFLAPPFIVACGFGWPSWHLGVEGVNSRVGKWILSLFSTASESKSNSEAKIDFLESDIQGNEPRLRGWCLMDFCLYPTDFSLVRLLVECNYRGRKAGEEGW